MSFISKFTKRDLAFSVVTGLITGSIAWRIFDFLNIRSFDSARLVFLLPVLWVLGVLLGYLLGQWLSFFSQFGKFAAIGLTNAAIDFGALNLLIALTGATVGIGYVFIKAASFLSAVVPSYFWNKHWAFYNRAASRTDSAEFTKFFGVAVIAIFVNTLIASIIVNDIVPMFGMTSEQWANIAAAAGSLTALIFSFLGFKFAVFRR